MNINILNTFDTEGGASVAAYRLYKGLRAKNQDVKMIVLHKKSSTKTPGIYSVEIEEQEDESKKKILSYMGKYYDVKNRTDLSNTLFSLPYPGYNISNAEQIKEADIINLHWVSMFQSVESLAYLINMDIPVVWTLHDQNPFTGGCHYTAGCTKYQDDCLNCPQLKDNESQIPFNVLKSKIDLWNKNITIVTPSKWLADCARNSRLFKRSRIEVIPNALETDIFKPFSKEEAKADLDINPMSICLLFGAFSSNERRKGFQKFVEAMKCCLRNNTFRKKVREGTIQIISFGPEQEALKKFNLQVKSMGFISDYTKIAKIYSAADLFILPSLEDNLPNTILEAMACGTPVLGFEIGGLPDIIKNGITGYTIPAFDVKALGERILQFIADKNNRAQMFQNCRQVIEKKFNLHQQATHYLELFKDLVNCSTRNPKFKRVTRINSKDGKIIVKKSVSDRQRDFLIQGALEQIKVRDQMIEKIAERERKLTHVIKSKNSQISMLLDREKRLSNIIKSKNSQIESIKNLLLEREKKLSNIIKMKSRQIDELLKKTNWKNIKMFRVIHRGLKYIKQRYT